MRTLGDSLLQSALALLALIVAILGLLLPSRPPPRQLDAVLENYLSCISVFSGLAGISVKYKGQDVSSLYLAEIRLAASGSQEIQSSDFDKPITFTSLGALTIADASIENGYPTSLNANLVRISPQQVELTPLALNPGDYFHVRLTIASAEPIACHTIDGVLRMGGHVLGTPDLALREPLIQSVSRDTWLVAGGGALGLASSLLGGMAMLILRKWSRSKSPEPMQSKRQP